MRTTRFSSPRALARIHNAVKAGLFGCAAEDAGAAGGSGAAGAQEKKPDDKGKQEEKGKAGEPEKLSLTQAELDAKLRDARADEKRKLDAAAQKKKDDDDAAAAKEQGKFEKLYNDEKGKRETAETVLETERRERKVEKALRSAAAAHEGYPADVFDKYVMPTLLTGIAADASDEAITLAAKNAAADYVKDNPRQPKGGGPPPPLPRQPQRPGQPNGKERQQPARELSTASRRF